MKRKIVGIYLIAIGIICLLCALFLMCYQEYNNRQIELGIQQGLRDSVFVVAKEEVPAEQESVELVDIIGSVDRDQEIEEVVTFKNVLDIPKIECRAKVGVDTSAYSLAVGVGHHEDTPKVGDVGNCVIAGHASRTYKCIFNRLEEMQILDEFYAYDAKGVKHTYTIIQRFVCSPNQLSILDNTSDGRSTITIYTCTEGGTMRFVIRGTEFTGDGLEEFKAQYFSDSISHMRTLNSNMNVEEVTKLLGMRSTKRVYMSDEYDNFVTLRPWATNEKAMFSDADFLNFGIRLNQEVDTDDVAQDSADVGGGEEDIDEGGADNVSD